MCPIRTRGKVNEDMEKDRSEYQAFTKPAEVHKAVNTLRGLVAGINSDASVGEKELDELINWCELLMDLFARL